MVVVSIAIVNLLGPIVAYQLLPGASQTVRIMFVLGYFSTYGALTYTLFRLLRK
jgi:hypothetical protein